MLKKHSRFSDKKRIKVKKLVTKINYEIEFRTFFTKLELSKPILTGH